MLCCAAKIGSVDCHPRTQVASHHSSVVSVSFRPLDNDQERLIYYLVRMTVNETKLRPELILMVSDLRVEAISDFKTSNCCIVCSSCFQA
ncbi:hypothetical protein TSUD_99150 [Trifolium subterraneum]|uniref:Uncharacterized protein n=1 Tax=Trifolium subterraneum TaxID=3900 RepID=A0A2Z6PI08_TRISU|nr:hypothetical protein TSUD_99150 [Trifolium subterraneum]